MRLAWAVIIILTATASAAPSAEQLYDEGQRAFDRKDYATAINQWRASYGLSKQPLLVLNVAQAYRLAGDCVHALAEYHAYVALDPTSDQRGLAEGFVAELESKCGQPSASHLPATTPEPGRDTRLIGLATEGAGVALLASGLVLGHHASTLGDDVTQACSVSCSWADQRSKDATGRRDTTIGYALDAVGVAAILGGTILYFAGDRRRAITISPRPREGGAAISWCGTW